MTKAHSGKSGKDGTRPPDQGGAVSVRESFGAGPSPRRHVVASSAKEIEASIEAVKGPPLEGRRTKADVRKNAIPIDPSKMVQVRHRANPRAGDGAEVGQTDAGHLVKALAAFDKLIQERPVLGPGMLDDTLQHALDQYCLIGKRLIEFFFADESINSATLAGDIERALRRALAQMDEDRQRRLIAALMSLAGELQSARVLSTVPPQRLARVALLIGQAHATAIDEPTATQRVNLATIIEHGREEEEHDGPPLWRERERDPVTMRRPTAIEWFDLHWKPLVLAGEVTGDDIRREDFKFYETLASYQNSKGKKLSDLLPPSPTRAKKDETAEERAERLRKSWRDSKRRARQRPHPLG